MSLQVDHLSKRFAGRPVVHDVSFSVEDGEIVSLLGPSGSGKSTILRMVAGLASADGGTILVDGRDVTALPPQARDLGFVFQNYALFEHLTVAENVEFALRVRKQGRAQRRQRRDALLEMVGLGGSARKYPSQLSGGQRQRTALARALAHQPRLLLLDEPFGALDARIRQDLRQELRTLLKQLGTTAIFVTHDQEEAFAVSDRILVLHRGRLLEQGEPRDLYQAPRSEFAASFVGRANLLPGELTSKGVRVRLPGDPARADALPGRIKVLLRPEEIWLDEPGTRIDSAPQRFMREATVLRSEYLGATERIYLELETLPAGTSRRRFHLEVLRSIEESRLLPLAAGDQVSVLAKQLHAVSQSDLRVLVVASNDGDGRQLVESMLAWGERNHVRITVLGSASGSPELATRLEGYRQSFAGDLRLIDARIDGADGWHVVRDHLQGERHDLVVLPPALRDIAALLPLLAETDVQHVLLAATAPLPFEHASRWQVIVDGGSGRAPDLEVLAELADKHAAAVDITRVAPHATADTAVAPSASRWRDTLTAWQVRYLEDDRTDAAADPISVIDADAALTVLDLGPRAGLRSIQHGWLERLPRRWTWLVIQHDEADLGLRPLSGYRPLAHPQPHSTELP